MAGHAYQYMKLDTLKSRPVPGATHEICTHEELALYKGLLEAMLKDVANCISTYTEEERLRDYQEISSRIDAEGIAFITKTLPSFAKAVDRALAWGDKLEVRGFKRAAHSVIPRFLHGVTQLIFDCDGMERSDACPLAVKSIRQIGYLFYKLRLPFAEEAVDKVINDFIHTDETLDYNPANLSFRANWVRRYAKTLIKRVLATVNPYDEEKFSPKHGPGAVATGEKGTKKGIFKRYYKALALRFPYEKYFYFNLTHLCDQLQEYTSLEELEAGTAKVVLVPKDSRGPRLISCEPLEYQWIQQGLMRILVERIETHPLTKGRVNFSDQGRNRDLAMGASITGLRVTLDMKEASDRVSLALVQDLFPTVWYEALSASRSPATCLPDGRVVTLKKFAPMGSAVCFPVEALIFWALATASTAYYELSESQKGCKALVEAADVFVYGDDIICPTEDYRKTIMALEEFGLKFNLDKCCTGAHFRESCGMDAFNGVDVTPVRIQARWCPSLTGMEYFSYVSYVNRLRSRGFYRAANYLEMEIQDIRRTPYSARASEIGVAAFQVAPELANWLNDDWCVVKRWNKRFHYTEYQGWFARARIFTDADTPGWSELQRIAAQKWGFGTPTDDGISRDISPRLAPTIFDFPSNWMSANVGELEAYQYTLPRRCSQRRGWSSV